MSSMVMSVDHPGLTFNLTLVRSEPTYNQPVQQWTFTSDFAVSMTAWNLFVPWCTTWNIPCVNLCARAAVRTDTDWRLSICPLYSIQVRDYSGTYTVKLIPCTTAQNMEYTVPPVCSPREPITFDLDIRFQQVRQSLFEPWDPKVACFFVIGRFSFFLSLALSPPLFCILL